MNELKDRWFWAYPTESVDCDGITGSAHEVYAKSEVDEVNAEKDKELRHQKHKRCLAMAMWCDTKADWYYGIGRSFRDRVEFYIKWYKRWLELANKF